jgi:hypothetical protein
MENKNYPRESKQMSSSANISIGKDYQLSIA